jgi:hypothetical protein
VPGGFVDLQCHLRRSWRRVRRRSSLDRRLQQLDSLGGDALCFGHQIQSADVLPSSSGRVAVKGVGKAPALHNVTVGGHREDHRSGLYEVLLLK